MDIPTYFCLDSLDGGTIVKINETTPQGSVAAESVTLMSIQARERTFWTAAEWEGFSPFRLDDADSMGITLAIQPQWKWLRGMEVKWGRFAGQSHRLRGDELGHPRGPMMWPDVRNWSTIGLLIRMLNEAHDPNWVSKAGGTLLSSTLSHNEDTEYRQTCLSLEKWGEEAMNYPILPGVALGHCLMEAWHEQTP